MTNYARGADLERRVQAHLDELGYLTIRSAGSHGSVDLVALGKGVRLLVQVKRDPLRVSCEEWNDLWTWATRVSALALVVGYPRGTKRLAWYRLLGPRLEGERGRPWGGYVVEGA